MRVLFHTPYFAKQHLQPARVGTSGSGSDSNFQHSGHPNALLFLPLFFFIKQPLFAVNNTTLMLCPCWENFPMPFRRSSPLTTVTHHHPTVQPTHCRTHPNTGPFSSASSSCTLSFLTRDASSASLTLVLSPSASRCPLVDLSDLYSRVSSTCRHCGPSLVAVEPC